MLTSINYVMLKHLNVMVLYVNDKLYSDVISVV